MKFFISGALQLNLELTEKKRLSYYHQVNCKSNAVEQSFKCNICDKVFADNPSLTIHKSMDVSVAHDDGNCKPFKCDLCNEAFTQKDDLKSHKSEVHFEYYALLFGSENVLAKHNSDEKRFSCSLCEYSGNSKNHLYRHVQTCTGEKPLKCKYCDKSYAHSSTLVIHERNHAGEKPFQGRHCDKAFVQTSQQVIISLFCKLLP